MLTLIQPSLKRSIGYMVLTVSAYMSNPVTFVDKEVRIFVNSHKGLQYWDTNSFKEVGYIAYCNGLRCYDDGKPCSLRSYLKNRIVNALKNHVKSESIRVVNDSFSNMESKTPKCDLKLDLERALLVLNDRERDMLLQHLRDNRTLSEIGEQYGLSKSRVYQIVKVSRAKVMKRFDADDTDAGKGNNKPPV